MKYLLDTDSAIDEIHVLYRSDTDTDDILILIIPIPVPIPITYHLKFIPPREHKCFDRDFEGLMAKISKRLQSGVLFRDLGYR